MDPRSCPLPYIRARALAREHGWREKVLIYVTRNDELLVLEHVGEHAATAGVQVPGGGVDAGETPRAAARELFEETGLGVDRVPTYLGSHLWTTDEAPSRVRHYYWVSVPPETPDRWSHRVSAGEADQGMTFRLIFRPLTDPGLSHGYGWEAGLGRLPARWPAVAERAGRK